MGKVSTLVWAFGLIHVSFGSRFAIGSLRSPTCDWMIVMETGEVSPARGIKGILTKPKSSRETSTAPAPENSPRRDSEDSLITKIKSRIGSVDEDEASEGKISKLLPGHNKRKEKRRRKAQDIAAADSTEDLRGRSTRKNPPSNLSASESLSTPNDEHSSLMTSESEEEQ